MENNNNIIKTKCNPQKELTVINHTIKKNHFFRWYYLLIIVSVFLSCTNNKSQSLNRTEETGTELSYKVGNHFFSQDNINDNNQPILEFWVDVTNTSDFSGEFRCRLEMTDKDDMALEVNETKFINSKETARFQINEISTGNCKFEKYTIIPPKH